MTGTGQPPAVRWGRRQPDPVHGWVAVVPRRWPGPEGYWLDLDGRRLQNGGRAGAGLALALPGALDDTVYLPPVAAGRRDERDRLARRCRAGGAPVLAQLLPGEEPPEGASALFDLTPALLGRVTSAAPAPEGAAASASGRAARAGSPAGGASRRAERSGSRGSRRAGAQSDLPFFEPPRLRLPAEGLPEGAAVLWPLIAGLTDGAEVRDGGLRRLAEAGVGAVYGIAVEVSPGDRRALAALGDDTLYDRLFHGASPSERAFAAAVAARGMEPLPPRPATPTAGGANRGLSAALALLGELWLRLGRSEARGQAFYAAARWIDGEEHDLAAIHRDGNLGVVSWLDEASRAVVEELLAAGRSTLLDEVRAEYLDPKEIAE